MSCSAASHAAMKLSPVLFLAGTRDRFEWDFDGERLACGNCSRCNSTISIEPDEQRDYDQDLEVFDDAQVQS